MDVDGHGRIIIVVAEHPAKNLLEKLSITLALYTCQGEISFLLGRGHGEGAKTDFYYLPRLHAC